MKRRPDQAENPQAERACLAGLLMAIDIDAAGVREVAAGLEPGAFTDPVNCEIMACIHEALAADRPGVGAVQAAARRRVIVTGQDHHDVIVGIADLCEREYVGSAPVENARLAAHEVRQAHGQRQALTTLTAGLEGIRGARDASDIRGVIERLQAVQASLGEPVAKDPTTSLFDELDSWSRDECDPVIPTGFAPLDSRIDGGLPPGLVGIAGQPGSGKSAFASQLLLGALLEDRSLTALWCRGEMSPKRLSGRLVAAWASIRGDAVPAITLRDARRRTKASRAVSMDMAEIVGADRLRFLPAPLTVERIAAAIAKNRPKLVVVDHLGRVQGDGKHDRRAELELIVQQLDDIATGDGITMIVTTPVAKTATEDSAIGTITRDSNRLDFDAECYVSLWVNPGDRKGDPREVRVVLNKTRSGHEDKVSLQFSGSGQSFYSTEPLPEEFDEFAAYAPGAPR
jgi:replicative DNA helicase